jgi:hypothetical protein
MGGLLSVAWEDHTPKVFGLHVVKFPHTNQTQLNGPHLTIAALIDARQSFASTPHSKHSTNFQITMMDNKKHPHIAPQYSPKFY